MYLLFIFDPELRDRERPMMHCINRVLAAMPRRSQAWVLECLMGARIMYNSIRSVNDDSDESGDDMTQL
jgi:hypothetical protein